MTDDRLDRKVRDADPYRPELIDLRGAEHDLLEEIMSETTAAPRRLRPARRLAVSLATAAAVVGAVAVGAVLHDQPGQPTGPAAGGATSAPGTATSGPASRWTLAAVEAAKANPRLLIDQPGWRAKTVYGFAEKTGTISFHKGDLGIEMNWYPADQYAGFFEDRGKVSKPQPGKAGDWPGDILVYSPQRFAIMLKPRDGAFVEISTVSDFTRAQFDQLLPLIKQVDVDTWLAALPPEIVTPDKAGDVATELLADIPLPPNFDKSTLEKLGTNDQYQFGAGVTSKVGCAWITEWKRADKAGDTAARAKAAAALRGSHDWKVLKSMADEGGWSDVFWEIADQVAAGKVPDGYESGIGCE
jgi:hypothetical protein